MLANYIDQAMELAVYEIIQDEGTYWGEIQYREYGRVTRLQGEDILKCSEVMLPSLFPIHTEGDISVGLLLRLLKQAGVSREEWLG